MYYPRLRSPMPLSRARHRAGLVRPAGVERAALDAMLAYLRGGIGDNLLAIDRAANNTSVVLALEWRGLRLLFAGDAELKSWHMMNRQHQLKPVHFYKIGHHGSCNGTPSLDLLNRILPRSPRDAHPRYALLSTCPGAYDGVPSTTTVNEIRRRVDRVYSTRSVPLGRPLQITFDAI